MSEPPLSAAQVAAYSRDVGALGAALAVLDDDEFLYVARLLQTVRDNTPNIRAECPAAVSVFDALAELAQTARRLRASAEREGVSA